MLPSSRSKYIAVAEWLVKTAKVTVDGMDLSKTTALMHTVSAKRYIDTDFVELMLENKADLDHRNRFDCNAAYDIVRVYQFAAATVDK